MNNYDFETVPRTPMEVAQYQAFQACPLDWPDFRSLYWRDYVLSQECLGPDLCESRIPGQDFRRLAENHSVTCLQVATASMDMIVDESGLQSWSPGRTGDLASIWALAAWRFALVAPIGYVVSSHNVSHSGRPPYWNPMHEDLSAFSSNARCHVSRSRRYLAPRIISFGTFLRLFSGESDSEFPWLSSAVANAFSESPNPDNPIFNAFRLALRKVLGHRRHLAYPFWWIELFNDYDGVRDDHVRLGLDVAPTDRKETKPASLHSPSDLQARAVLAFVHQSLQADKFKVNCAGADFHVVDGALHLVSPGGWERVALRYGRAGLSGSLLASMMLEFGYVVPDPQTQAIESIWHIFPANYAKSKPVSKCRLTRLSDQAVRILYPDGLPYDDNKDFTRGA